ncbi:beta-lactamase-like protein [Chaetomium sp. MPI-SDFR-AT-0129]|nr:beta-lactamase-like protein [Chaetomium sp. MPI-SDFR-AT-0129]
MADSLSYLICNACGTQHPTADRASLPTCFICDDPRQFVPASGQSFTTLQALRDEGTRRNEFIPLPNHSGHSTGADPETPQLTAIVTTPSFGIGQRAILVRTPAGNVLWDCVAYLDDATVEALKRLGGIQAMVISHPHFYTTHLEWAARFECPVYLAAEDAQWLARPGKEHDTEGRRVFLEEVETKVVIGGVDSGVRIVKLGGHFPGSQVLVYDGYILTADTLMMTPAGKSTWKVDALGNPRTRPPGVNSFTFMWSIPNMIPLNPTEITRIWHIVKNYEFRSAHGGFVGADIVDDVNLKSRVLDSMKIQIRAMGYDQHPLLEETV